MSTELRIPKLGMSMEEGTLQEWCVKKGDTVKEGDVIYLLETDKSIQEIEAPAGGKIEIIGQEGELYPVGEVIGYIE